MVGTVSCVSHGYWPVQCNASRPAVPGGLSDSLLTGTHTHKADSGSKCYDMQHLSPTVFAAVDATFKRHRMFLTGVFQQCQIAEGSLCLTQMPHPCGNGANCKVAGGYSWSGGWAGGCL